MTDQEKSIWKVEIFKQSEDLDEEIDKRLHMIDEERERINNTVKNNKDAIAMYHEAVERIA
jgi:hypothetical protein